MNIGGVLNYELLARMNRPSDPTAIASEVRRLRRSGLQPRDIAQALRLDLASVREILVMPVEADLG